MKLISQFAATVVLALSSHAFALSIGSEIEKNLCTKNCRPQVNETIVVGADSLCKNEMFNGQSVTCCEAIPQNSDLNDAIVYKTLINERNYGTCGWETDGTAAPQNPASFCSADGCVDLEQNGESFAASLLKAFRQANSNGACERTIYSNGIYLRKGESVSVKAYRSYGVDHPATTFSCQ